MAAPTVEGTGGDRPLILQSLTPAIGDTAVEQVTSGEMISCDGGGGINIAKKGAGDALPSPYDTTKDVHVTPNDMAEGARSCFPASTAARSSASEKYDVVVDEPMSPAVDFHDNRSGGGGGGGGALTVATAESQQTEEHVSFKYTKEELMTRYWDMDMTQVKRAKALLRLGVNEDDLVVANKLLKLGRPVEDAPLTKEEQLLGYSTSQRQRVKALHTLGLTEDSFDRCRALMLGSLGPSAFGSAGSDKSAENAAQAAEEEGWTPSSTPRRAYSYSMLRVHGFFKMKPFNFGHYRQTKHHHDELVRGANAGKDATGAGIAVALHEGRSLPRRCSHPKNEPHLPNIQVGTLPPVRHNTTTGVKEDWMRARDVGGGGTAKGSGGVPLSARTHSW